MSNESSDEQWEQFRLFMAPPLNLLNTGCTTCGADSDALDRTGYEKKRDPTAFVGCSRFVTADITAFTDLCFALRNNPALPPVLMLSIH
jgi:hypothetical protein